MKKCPHKNKPGKYCSHFYDFKNEVIGCNMDARYAKGNHCKKETSKTYRAKMQKVFEEHKTRIEPIKVTFKLKIKNKKVHGLVMFLELIKLKKNKYYYAFRIDFLEGVDPNIIGSMGSQGCKAIKNKERASVIISNDFEIWRDKKLKTQEN